MLGVSKYFSSHHETKSAVIFPTDKPRGPSRNKTAYEIPNLWNLEQRFQIPNCILNKFKYKILKYSKIYGVSFKPNKPFEESNFSRINYFKCLYCGSVATTTLSLNAFALGTRLATCRQGGVTPQCSVIPPATAVKHKVKSQEAKIVKVKGQA